MPGALDVPARSRLWSRLIGLDEDWPGVRAKGVPTGMAAALPTRLLPLSFALAPMPYIPIGDCVRAGGLILLKGFGEAVRLYGELWLW